MLYGSQISNAPCGRCGQSVGTRNISYKDGRFFHERCFREYEKEVANRRSIITAITGEILIDEPEKNLHEF